MKRQKYRGFIRCILLAALLSLSDCGREDRQRGIDGYIYEAEQLSGTENWQWTHKCYGDWLYYVESSRSLLPGYKSSFRKSIHKSL